VQVEMITAEVGEDGDVEHHARHTVQGQCVGRDLHDDRVHAVGHVTRQQSLQIGRLGSRANAGQGSLHARFDARRAQNRGDEVARRRLAVGASNANRAQLGGGVVVHARREPTHCPAYIAYDHLWHVQRQRPLHE
jgi:hypothetical protein